MSNSHKYFIYTIDVEAANFLFVIILKSCWQRRSLNQHSGKNITQYLYFLYLQSPVE